MSSVVDECFVVNDAFSCSNDIVSRLSATFSMLPDLPHDDDTERTVSGDDDDDDDDVL